MKIMNASGYLEKLVEQTISSYAGKPIPPSEIIENTARAFIACWENSYKMYLTIKKNRGIWYVGVSNSLLKNFFDSQPTKMQEIPVVLIKALKECESIYGKVL
jgi:hypothetical protein